MKAFLICPVRKAESETQSLAAYVVERWEVAGHKVHWPPRDTNQIDETGLRICQDNRTAIQEADLILVIWDGKSQGCLFDLGIAFALRKAIYSIDLPPETEGKSFQNMIRAWEGDR